MNLIRQWDGLLAGVLLLLAIFLVFLEIILRGVFATSLMGVDQVASFFVVWSAFLGGSFAISKNLHVRVDLLAHCLPDRAAKVMEVAVLTTCVGYSFVLTYSGVLLVEESLLLMEVTNGFLRIPMWIPQLVMPLSGVLYTCRFAARLFQLLTGKHHSTGEANHVGSA